MYVRKTDLFVGTAIVLYIVFFALSPPSAVRTILSNPVGMASCFGVAVYVALYHSKAIGALLIVALLASMTKVTEHLTDTERATKQRELVEVTATVTQLQGLGLLPENNDALRNALARQTTLRGELGSATATPVATPSPSASAPSVPLADTPAAPPSTSTPPISPVPQPTGPAAASPPTTPPPAATAPPKPVMSCNIENFAAY